MTVSYRALRYPDVSSLAPEELSEAETNWVHFQPYLLSKGYQLRPRYRPGWQPSWKSTGAKPYDCEDSYDSLPLRALDAVRVIDDLQVMIKMIIPYDDDQEGEDELKILEYLSSEQCAADPANHAVRCLESFPMPEVERGAFCVMPLLMVYNNPPFDSLGEIYDLLKQLFEGLQFLHKNNIAHCDISPPNIMMDGRLLYDQPFNANLQTLPSSYRKIALPKYQRSQRPVRYYYIDFGYAKWFQDPTQTHVVQGIHARERAPEQLEGLYDPFKADIYQLGAIMRRDLIPVDMYFPPLPPTAHLATELPFPRVTSSPRETNDPP
ncbi:unnamed protein product [Rhizoctonia solani]|uniref:Protein kinase domain-containing protein n=1 Tax=Rhizoctonia solani TaxID=456999 RepID=A0A8H3H463_9AGAM|nr:unnamed protein product [Rhizoctonia solani]CAE6530771.1 unnamed protein product [Rhizoctonia solani]